jgi:serine/threonine protein kinase
MIHTQTKQIKLIDFGSLTLLERGVPVKCFYGTKKFSSPEALRGPYLPEFQEVWALGTLLYVLLFKMDPFKNDDEILQLDISKRIERIRQQGVNGQRVHVSEQAIQLLLKIMDKDWSQRPRVDQILSFSLFT